MSHARLSPSAAHRWKRCGKSIHLDDALREANDGELPEQKVGPAAIYGSAAHGIAESAILRAYKRPYDVKQFDEDCGGLLDNVQTYIDWVTAFLGPDPEKNGLVWNVEAEFPLWYEPESVGTVDFWAIDTKTSTLYVVDYKSGIGYVGVQDNDQLGIYALAAVQALSKTYKILEVQCGIAQPAVSEGRSELVRWWTLDVVDLKEVKQEVDAAVIQIDEKVDLDFEPSDTACQWCRHKLGCPALIAKAVGVMEKAQSAVGDLSDIEIAEMWKTNKELTSFWAAIDEKVREMDGATLKAIGMKRVRGNRKFAWRDDALFVEFFESIGHDSHEHSLLTPAKAKKVLAAEGSRFGPESLEEYLTWTFRPPMLVSSTDRRAAIDLDEIEM